MSASCDVLVFHTTQRCHSVFSWRCPDGSFHVRLVASENVATRFPPVVERTSGSFPRFPINVTLFKLRLTIPPGARVVPARASVGLASESIDSAGEHCNSIHARGTRVLQGGSHLTLLGAHHPTRR